MKWFSFSPEPGKRQEGFLLGDQKPVEIQHSPPVDSMLGQILMGVAIIGTATLYSLRKHNKLK